MLTTPSTSRSRSPQRSTSQSMQPSTSRSRSPQRSTSQSTQPSTSRSRSPQRSTSRSTQPSTSRVSCRTVTSLAHDTYNSIIIEDDDQYDEDAAFQLAVQNSLLDNNDVSDGLSLEDALNRFCGTDDHEQMLLIQRSAILRTTRRAVRKPAFRWTGKLKIQFSGEIGDDCGGPRREYLRLLSRELMSTGVFEGSDDRLTISLDHDLMESKEYELVGALVAMIVFNRGPAPKLARAVYDSITGVPDTEDLTADLIADFTLRERVAKVMSCDIGAYPAARESVEDWCADNGFINVGTVDFENRRKIELFAVTHYVLRRPRCAIEQFCSGMDKVHGLYAQIKSTPAFRDLFTGIREEVTSGQLLAMLEPQYSEVGVGNLRAKEEDSVFALNEVILAAEVSIPGEESKISLNDLMVFVTGTDTVPVLGFDSKIKIKFFDDEGRLPSASTCELFLSIPRGVEPERLQSMLEFSIGNAPDFGKA